jgi:hypothetical protein
MRHATDLDDADRAALEHVLRKIEDVGIRVAAELGADVGTERDCRGRVPALTFRARGFAPAQDDAKNLLGDATSCPSAKRSKPIHPPPPAPHAYARECAGEKACVPR